MEIVLGTPFLHVGVGWGTQQVKVSGLSWAFNRWLVLAAAAAGKKRDIMGESSSTTVVREWYSGERDQVAHHSQGLVWCLDAPNLQLFWTLGPQGLRPLQPSFQGALHLLHRVPVDNTASGWHFGAQGPFGHCTSIDGQWLPLQVEDAESFRTASWAILCRGGMIPDFDEILILGPTGLGSRHVNRVTHVSAFVTIGTWAVLEVISHALPGGWGSWGCYKTFEAPRVFWWNFWFVQKDTLN